jgi:hypothetical protein
VVRLPILAIATSLLAAGCCCPAISGRYCEVGMPAPQQVASAGGAEKGAKCDPEKGGHVGGRHAALHGLHGLHGLLGRHGWGASDRVPSQQQYDYVGPLPKFHPAPVRPVFEPQFFYEPPVAGAATGPSVPSGKHSSST